MVKKIIIPILFLMLTQLGSRTTIRRRIVAGFNATQVEGDSFKGYNKPGIIAGFYVQTDVAPAVFTGMEIKFSQKGSRKRIKPKDPNPEVYIMRLNYIDVPLCIWISHK